MHINLCAYLALLCFADIVFDKFKVVATLCQASLLAPFFQQHFMSHICVTF